MPDQVSLPHDFERARQRSITSMEHGLVEPAAMSGPDLKDPRSPPARVIAATRSPRDLEVLRSFARRIVDSDASAHNNLGVVYYRGGMYAEAVEQLERALELDPGLHVAQRNLRIVCSVAGYHQQVRPARHADPSAWRAAEQRSSDADAKACLSLDGHNMARYEELISVGSGRPQAGEVRVPAPELDPPDPRAAAERGRREAIHILADALNVEPNHVPSLIGLGDLLADANREREANIAYRRALRLDPSSRGARAGLERLAPIPSPQPRGA